MEKYSYEWCAELMHQRGYESYAGYKSNWWVKGIGDISDDDYFSIFAKIDTTPGEEGIQLSSNVLKSLITIQTPYIQVDHPLFEDFERRLKVYINGALQQDYIEEAVRQRQEDRKNRRTL